VTRTDVTFRLATPEDAATLAALVGSAYRGEESRAGWTTEANFLDDERIDAAGVLAKITDPQGVVLVVQDSAAELIGCCEVAYRGAGLAYFGMFAIRPALQAGGLGRLVLTAAEELARRTWGADAMEMTVIGQRVELIAWYERRGYTRAAETRPFPYEALRDDLYFAVLTKPL
jgi:GNAT superfamily N-acetyltransferase